MTYENLVLGNACSDIQERTGECENQYNKVAKLGLLSVLSYYRRLNNELYGIFLNNRKNEVQIKKLLNSDRIREFGISLIIL